jgi:hypothetical protein
VREELALALFDQVEFEESVLCSPDLIDEIEPISVRIPAHGEVGGDIARVVTFSFE